MKRKSNLWPAKSCGMQTYEMTQVDVFTDRAFGGNALAVFTRAEGLDDATMQAIARETNLSETTFVFAAEGGETDARVRIFTPATELPFAGHPTIGTAFVLLSRLPKATSVRVGLNVGPIRVEREPDGALFMDVPQVRFLKTIERRAEVAESLGLRAADLADLPIEIASSGYPYLLVPLQSAQLVDAARLNVSLLTDALGEDAASVFPFACNGEARFYARMFAPHTAGIAEDPATGSANGPFAAYARKYGLLESSGLVEQGTKMRRQSFIRLRVDAAGNVKIGGNVVEVLRGTLTVPGRL